MSDIEIKQDELQSFVNDFSEKQDEYVEHAEKLKEYVEDFSKNSDIAYTHLVKCVDDLSKEINFNSDETERQISQIKLSDKNGEYNRNSELGLIISRSRNYLSDVSKYLNNMQHTDQKIFGEIKTHISKVDEVKTSIQSVEELSTDIEILAFNAMIVAAKAGKEGLAFSCITDELKNISNQTLLIVNDLMGLEKNLFEHYNNFQETIVHIEENHAKTIDYLEKNIEEAFADFTMGVDTISDLAEDIIKHFNLISPYFRELRQIVELKKEIPESTQVVLESLSLIDLNKKELFSQETYDAEAILQLLLGQSRISKYCNVLFNDINQHLQLSLGIVDEKLNEVSIISKSVRTSENVLKEYFTSDTTFGENSIQIIFNDISNSVTHITDLVENTIEGKKEISENGQSLINRIEELEEQFLFLTKTAKKFNLINISSKIEIAKRKVLSNHGNISDKIEEITEEIGKTLYATYDQLVLIKKSTQHLLGQYNTNMLIQVSKADDLLGKIQDSMDEYSKSKDQISTTFSSLKIVSDEFIDLLKVSQNDVKEIMKLDEYAEHISELFSTIFNLVENSKNQLLKMVNMKEDEVPTPHYDRIFRKIDLIENIYNDFAKDHSTNAEA